MVARGRVYEIVGFGQLQHIPCICGTHNLVVSIGASPPVNLQVSLNMSRSAPYITTRFNIIQIRIKMYRLYYVR